MIRVDNIAVGLEAGLPGHDGLVTRAVAHTLGVREDALVSWKLLRRSVDARKKDHVHFVVSVAVELSASDEKVVVKRGVRKPAQLRAFEPYRGYTPPVPAHDAPRPVVAGFGPAGLFAAWALARAGMRPIVVERGQDVDARTQAVEAFFGGGELDPQSNVQFGEGGAGLFSDGKLNTGIKGAHCADVLHAFVDAGAPEEILWQAKPHIGTDLLPGVVKRMRQDIEGLGGEVRFDTQLTGLRFEAGRLCGVEVTRVRASATDAANDVLAGAAPAIGEVEGAASAIGEVEVVPARDVVVALGHSARDSMEALRDAGFQMQRKPFAVGVRIEHLQEAIDRAQYEPAAGHPALGPADYKLAVHLEDGRGVYTFCMCPGGEVVPAASEPGGVCTNGMSRFARDGRNANAAVLVDVRPDDLSGDDVLEGVRLQRRMERAAYRAAGQTYAAPAQRVGDFLASEADSVSDADSASGKAVAPTYARGVVWCDLHDVLPGFVSSSIAEALPLFDRRLHGFADPGAVMTGVEARSSCPIRLVRDKVSLQAPLPACAQGQTEGSAERLAHELAEGPMEGPAGSPMVGHAEGPATSGVFPAGEGAGYAGGIMSAAVDGLRVAEALIAQYV